jgi:RimJ/RimL family protein N-acetyltransferase
MHMYLQTDRLLLRRFTPADVNLLVALNSDPAVMRFVTGGTPTPRAVIEDDLLPGYLASYARYAGFGFWPALEQATGTVPRRWSRVPRAVARYSAARSWRSFSVSARAETPARKCSRARTAAAPLDAPPSGSRSDGRTRNPA